MAVACDRPENGFPGWAQGINSQDVPAMRHWLRCGGQCGQASGASVVGNEIGGDGVEVSPAQGAGKIAQAQETAQIVKACQRQVALGRQDDSPGSILPKRPLFLRTVPANSSMSCGRQPICGPSSSLFHRQASAASAQALARMMSGVPTLTSPHCARWRKACSMTTSASMASAIGVARMPTHGSCRPLVTTSAGWP